jgi:acyl-coenzyme A synthetase/AMP-(fatty) acid ligase
VHELSHPAGGSLPVLRGYAPGAVVTWSQGRPVPLEHFCAHALALAARLPAHGAILNLCEQRANFLLGWVAALVRGATTVLPSDRTSAAITRATEASGAGCALSDSAPAQSLPLAVPRVHVGYDGEIAAAEAVLPDIPAQQIAALLYSSGSTGIPSASSKHWGGLVSGARTLGRMLGWQDCQRGSVIGAVAPQHMFGLETTVMLPLQWGRAVYSERPLLPADLANALRRSESLSWLMLTPLHAAAYAAAEIEWAPAPAGVISSTMPLPAATAQALERRWHVPIMEIYGSTETGMIGLRRTANAGEWQLADDLQLDYSGDIAVLGGRDGMAPHKLVDRISVAGARSFALLGRSADLVKVGGNRASLSELTACLLRIAGVRDAAIVQEDEGSRLVALVVAAPGTTVRDIRAQFALSVDPVFMPRPLWLVDTLPRNDNGKLPRDAVLEAINRLRGT